MSKDPNDSSPEDSSGAGPRCTIHTQRPARATCPRCGQFCCEQCCPPEQKFCLSCRSHLDLDGEDIYQCCPRCDGMLELGVIRYQPIMFAKHDFFHKWFNNHTDYVFEGDAGCLQNLGLLVKMLTHPRGLWYLSWRCLPCGVFMVRFKRHYSYAEAAKLFARIEGQES